MTDFCVIAELAQGFEGSQNQSKLLIKAAALAKANAVKFQLVYADELATPDYKYYDLFRSLEMDDSDWSELANYSKTVGVSLILDIFGQRSLDLAQSLSCSMVKLHGTDTNNVGLLHQVADSSIPSVMLGCGGAYLPEIMEALNILKEKSVILMFGFQSYPTPTESNNIARISSLREVLRSDYRNVEFGFSDHADPLSPLSFALAAAAVGAGATCIEKHLTLGRVMQLEDYESALNPDQFLEFSSTLKDVHSAIGKESTADDFEMSESEMDYRLMIRRHVIAAHNLPSGTVIQPSDVILKRCNEDDIITDPRQAYGKKLTEDISHNNPIKFSALQ
jgi:N,N'-diacetyllegionaminate synthase